MSRTRKRKRKREETLGSEEEELLELQRQAYTAATTWHDGLALGYLGVDMGKCLDYMMVQNVNNAILNTMRESDG